MRTVRRLYFYAVAFITLEVVLWGLINLLRSIVQRDVLSTGDTLAQALALILVGVPIFALHWIWAQRASATDVEEHSASLRAVFLYGVLLATLIPVVQNGLALVNRTFIESAGFAPYRALAGGNQTWTDNLIAIVMNAVAAWYFLTVLRADWQTLSDTENFADIRRLYRYIWVLYSLLMVIIGAQQIIRFLMFVPGKGLGEVGRELFINGTALLLIGTPIWFFAWRACQEAFFHQPGERDSNLRLGILYFLALSGVTIVLSAAGVTLNVILRRALGEDLAFAEILRRITGSVSIGLPLGAVWAYYGYWLRQSINAAADEQRRAALNRIYLYILSFIGLATSFIGLASLVAFVIDVAAGKQIWGDEMRARISGVLATLAVGLPLWLSTWRPIQKEALAEGAAGDHARRSVTRKIYLYLVLFASVIGGMVSAVGLVFQLLQAALGSETLSLVSLLNMAQVLAWFILVLVYHLSCLRADSSGAARTLSDRYAQFPVAVFETAGSGFGEAVRAEAQKQVPGLPVTVIASGGEIPEEAAAVKAVLLPLGLMVALPDATRKWLGEFGGSKIVVPTEVKDWLWIGSTPRRSVTRAVLAVRQMAEGQAVRVDGGGSGWTIVAYVFAALFALQLLFVLLMLGISAFVD
ncbi:MAG: DUF5671 domain-containing protein [Chloroflexota bacterium]